MSVLLVAGILSLASCSVPSAGVVGRLPKLVPWILLSTGIPCVYLEARDAPLEELRLDDDPRWDGARFFALQVGNGPDDLISGALALPNVGAPLLIVDVDNDEDLSDESWRGPDALPGARWCAWFPTVSPEYGEPNSQQSVSYTVTIGAAYSYFTAAYDLYYSGFCHRRGQIELSGEVYEIAVASLGSNGQYSDLDQIVFAIDVDRDGVIDERPWSHEVFGPGQPILTDAGEYRIDSVAIDGSEVVLERVGDAEARAAIGRGEPLPPILSTTVDGRSTASACEDRVCVVLFADDCTERDPACDACSEESASRSERIIEPLAAGHDWWDNEGPTLILVLGDECSDAWALGIQESVAFPVFAIRDEAVTETYRRNSGVIVADSTGTIVALDEVWIKPGPALCFPRGEVEWLSPDEVRAVVERLLETP